MLLFATKSIVYIRNQFITIHMTEKKIPTVEQLNDFRQQVKTAVTSSDYDKLNAFIEEYDLYTKVFEENGKMGVKDAAGQILVPAEFGIH